MTITKEKRDELELRVESFFEKNNIQREEYVDITKVCDLLKIQVSSLTFPDKLRKEIDGLILVKGDEKKIGFNRDLEPRKARFVIAHELAHYITHYMMQEGHLAFAFKDKIYHGAEKPLEEHEMDYMAAAILVPKKKFKLYLDVLKVKGNFTKDTVEDAVHPFIVELLANKFQVDTDLIYRRIIEVA